MDKLRKLVIVLTLMVSSGAPVLAQSGAADSLTLKVLFRQDVTKLERSYRGNGQMLDRFVDDVRAIADNPEYRIQDITIRSAASPEGTFDHNVDLSWNRGRALKEYLQRELMLPGYKFRIEAVGEDWVSLKEIVERNDIPDKDRILDILERHSDYIYGHPTSVIGGPKKELMNLNGGRTWFWLLENVFPELRSAGNAIVCRYVRVEEPAPAPHKAVRDTIVIINHSVDTIYIAGSSPQPAAPAVAAVIPVEPAASAAPVRRAPRRTPGYRFAVKTNVLYDALIAPNVEVEFPIGKRVSVLAFHNFPWYTFDSDRHAYEILNTGAEMRLWLGDRSGRSVLSGCYLGIYGASGKGDLEYRSKGYQVQGAWHAGITGGWSFPLGRNDNWRLDMGVGLGYLPLSYDYYERSEASGLLIYKRSGERAWIGPTNLRCTIGWMIPPHRKARKDKEDRQDD